MINSRHPLGCVTPDCLRRPRSCLSRSYAGNLPSSFNTVLSNALVYSTSPPVSVWGTVYKLELFPGTASLPRQSDKPGQLTPFVTSSRPRNIDLVPIGYGCRPRLRGRLTLSGLTLLRNPWTFGGSVSHTPFRYSCQHSHFRYLQAWSPIPFIGLRNAPLPRTLARTPAASARGFSPVTFSAQAGLTRPVSYYAFFKGWLLLSQPPGCLGLPTSFPT